MEMIDRFGAIAATFDACLRLKKRLMLVEHLSLMSDYTAWTMTQWMIFTLESGKHHSPNIMIGLRGSSPRRMFPSLSQLLAG